MRNTGRVWPDISPEGNAAAAAAAACSRDQPARRRLLIPPIPRSSSISHLPLSHLGSTAPRNPTYPSAAAHFSPPPRSAERWRWRPKPEPHPTHCSCLSPTSPRSRGSSFINQSSVPVREVACARVASSWRSTLPRMHTMDGSRRWKSSGRRPLKAGGM